MTYIEITYRQIAKQNIKRNNIRYSQSNNIKSKINYEKNIIKQNNVEITWEIFKHNKNIKLKKKIITNTIL